MGNNNSENTPEADDGYNVFRDSALRYMGYANEVGESFRYQFPKLVIPSYVLAFGYCFADAVTSGHDVYQKAAKKNSPTATLDSVVTTFDCLIWQSLASVMIPGATINAIVRASRFAVARSPAAVPVSIATWVPTVMGLGSVPLIIQPIDDAVHILMDATYRQIDFNGIFYTKPEDTDVDSSTK
jgi:fission process protein 1